MSTARTNPELKTNQFEETHGLALIAHVEAVLGLTLDLEPKTAAQQG